ncbi:phospholipid/cholesterol/gamma-HCH transport system substrate-binding protein [Marmoricola sp. OAE513]|uniref:MCE family protein n=1 Tax=Marmoricola sp. OAE513 TaxID=2817894 RepID=UPI001AE57B10
MSDVVSTEGISEQRKVRIAVIGLVGMLVAVLVTMNLQRLPFVGGGSTYRAEFADASGLVEGEEVRVAGIKVGQVTGIELGRGKVVVSFRVKGVDLGRRTTASIEVKTLLGQHYLSLDPQGGGDLGTIPLARTTTPINIVPAFQQLSSQVRDIDTAQVADAFDALTETLSSTAPQMKGTLQGLARLSRTITSRDDQVAELFARAQDVSKVVAARDEEIGDLLSDTATVLGILDQRRATIRQIIEGTMSLSRELTGLVKDNRATLKPVLAKLNRVLTVLRQNDKNIDEIIRYTSIYGREFTNVGGSGHFFDATVKAPAGAGLCATPNGAAGPLLSLLSPILTQVNEQVNGTSQPCLPLGPAGGTP